MKITKTRLKEIIVEELQNVMGEMDMDPRLKPHMERAKAELLGAETLDDYIMRWRDNAVVHGMLVNTPAFYSKLKTDFDLEAAKDYLKNM
jgi:hypothetical protein